MGEFRQILKKVEQIEKSHGDFVDFIVRSTIDGEKHMMRMEEDYASFALELGEVYQDLSDLEKADLEDFDKFIRKENGESI